MVENWQLKQRQNLELPIKIKRTKQKIKEWYKKNDKKVYVSWSGGLDSTVLAHIAREIYPDIPLVFSNTGLEYPEIVEFVFSKINNKNNYKEKKENGYLVRFYENNIVILRPKMNFKKVIEKYGYPVISKRTAKMLKTLQNPTPNNKATRHLYLTGEKRDGTMSNSFKLPEKWRKLIFAPFKISHHCCNKIKKQPFQKYKSITGNKPIVGTLASESRTRTLSYLKTGCNNFSKNGKSKPIAFWKRQDVLKYIKQNDIDYCKEIYGDIILNDKGEFETTGANRTGCMWCMFGVHMEEEPNRFQKMKKTHPKLWDFCMNVLDLKTVLEYIGVPYE